MDNSIGSFTYTTREGKCKGQFGIYQARNGAIYMLMGNKHTALTLGQINELFLDVYQLKDFSLDDYNTHYDAK